MRLYTCLKRFLFVLFFTCLSGIICFIYFRPIYLASSIILPFSLHPYDICIRYPLAWHYIKIAFIFFHALSSLLISNWIFSFFFHTLSNKTASKKSPLPIYDTQAPFLLVGKSCTNSCIYLSEKSLYQNILITGTIGCGKTSSCMYPFTKQLIEYQSSNEDKKLGMLILDVKGNYHQKILEFARTANRVRDVCVIELGGHITYNPLDKPDLKPFVLANHLKTILTLFSPNNSDSYWLDKVEETLTECIKFCRLYHNNYVTFIEIHKLVTIPDYYLDKLDLVKEKFLNGKLSTKDCHDVLSCINFFQNEFYALDDRTLNIIKSEITRITNCFISDYDIRSTFCPEKSNITFLGFKDLLEHGKIVVLNMNIAEYRTLSKILATYLKLDFQQEVLMRLAYSNSFRSVAFLCDEYHEYCTASDADFFAQSREAKCINIVATQSYSSLLHTINNPYTVKVITQNLINKLWLRTDDTFTIEDIQKQLGKEEKIHYSKTISENAKESTYSYFTNSFHSKNSALSESINQYTQNDYAYDTNFFTQKLETFSCLAFLSNGSTILSPMKLTLFPYFKS